MGLRAAIRTPVEGVYERRLLRGLARLPVPKHIAIMIDGNRRWARAAGFDDVSQGHVVGARHIADLLDWCTEAGVAHVTIWLLSTDNLRSRAPEELTPLLDIIVDVARSLSVPSRDWQVRVMGALGLLPDDIAAALRRAQDQTLRKSGITVNIAVGYGGRHEIVDAVRSVLREADERGASLAEVAREISLEDIANHLYTKGQPDPDLIIRTSGEQRLSGFLLWQTANSEFYFSDVYWPDFRRVDFLRAIREYAQRNRRFGA